MPIYQEKKANMALPRTCLWFAVLLWVGAWACAGEVEPAGRYLFKDYGPEQGLMDLTFSCMAQDKDGFLWIGTQGGLIRYDGTQFRKWTPADGLPASWVFRLRPCRDGGVWVCTMNGLVRFRDEVFHKVRVEGKELVGGAAAIDLDEKGQLWFLRRDGLYRQVGPDEFERVQGRPKGRSAGLACSPATGSAFVILDENLWERNKDGSWSALGPDAGLSADGLWGLMEDGRGRLWVAGVNKLFYRDAGEQIFHDASSLLPAPPFSDGVILKGADGSVGIPTNLGLLKVLGNTSELIDQFRGLPSKWVRAGMLDRENNLWIMGPSLFRLLGRGYVRAHTTADGLPGEIVWSIYRDHKDRLWAGTNDGLALLGFKGWSRIAGTEGLSISGLVMDTKGWLWLAPSTGPVLCLKPGETKATEQPFKALRWSGHIDGKAHQEPPDGAGILFVDRQGALWLGNEGRGVYRADLLENKIYLEYGPTDVGAPALVVKQFVEDAGGRIWVATNHGLLCKEGARWHRWGKAKGLRYDDLQGLALAGDGVLWAWYNEPFGLSKVAYENGTLKVVEQRNSSTGLASDSVLSVAMDAKGTLWVGTDRGLDRFSQGHGIHFGRGDGLVGEDCASNAIMADANGDIWQGTTTGLVHVLSSRELPAAPVPQVHLLQVTQGKTSFFPPFSPPQPVPHRDATLEFRFSAPTFINESAVQYQVRLAGLEDDWRLTDIREARYAALAGGRYRFEVRAAYPGGVFGSIASYDADILPPWWRSLWFTVFLIVGGAALVTLGVQLRLRSLAHQKIRLEAIVAERTEALTEVNGNNLRLIDELSKALAEVKTLRGLIPICCYCKKIRDDGGYWSQIEQYVQSHSEAKFSHGICPDCEEKVREEFAKEGFLFPKPKSD